MCDSEYDDRGLPIGAYDNIAENIMNNNNKRAQSAAEGNAVWEKVVTKTSENICPEYVTPEQINSKANHSPM
jgi:hypothetical protein